MKAFLVLFCAAVAFAWPAAVPQAASVRDANGDISAWNGYQVTWSPNLLSKYAFAHMPRKTTEDLKGFSPLDDLCSTTGTPFVGHRYQDGSDPSIRLIFDKNGIIAGMQTAIPEADFTPLEGRGKTHFVLYKGFWHLTAYFVDPSMICTTGRSSLSGTGQGLWIQNGTMPSMNIPVPYQQTDVAKTQWTLGHCFVTMGIHWWYDISADMDCGDFIPFFLLYNKVNGMETLNGWGFAINFGGDGSNRYEHPPHSAISGFMKEVPKCFSTNPAFAKLSTMHVYMSAIPETHDFC